jgi:hypothetical protein
MLSSVDRPMEIITLVKLLVHLYRKVVLLQLKHQPKTKNSLRPSLHKNKFLKIKIALLKILLESLATHIQKYTRNNIYS